VKDVSLLAELAKKNSAKSRALIAITLSKSQSSHIGSAYSVIDILSALYSNYSSEEFQNFEVRVLLSKGHAAIAQYAALIAANLVNVDLENVYCKNGSEYYGHVNHATSPLIPLSTGSLGHGLPFAVGISIGQLKNQNEYQRVFVIISDGECDEGTTWECALIANQFKLKNLCVVIDRNRLQSLASTEETLALEPLREKWESFGWEVRSVDGHNHYDILNSIRTSEKPLCIIAHTTKGKGVDFMENSVDWHYKYPDATILEDVLIQIGRES
jgi:transketolase